MDINKVYNVDCLNYINTIPDNFIDLVIVDPPYGDNSGYGRKNKTILNNESEEIRNSLAFNVMPVGRVGLDTADSHMKIKLL